mmetsp:Transcript_106085/g.242878  ORF Transcript_106085/g.242878 Transcript_106085/m.242878 type:complete len:155 (-) Transcript_106085:226-690(-)
MGQQSCCESREVPDIGGIASQSITVDTGPASLPGTAAGYRDFTTPDSETSTVVTGVARALPTSCKVWDVIVVKESAEERVGITLEPVAQHGGFRIRGIKSESAIARYNTANPESNVRFGDLVVSVNGCDTNLSDIVAALKAKQNLILQLKRVMA